MTKKDAIKILEEEKRTFEYNLTCERSEYLSSASENIFRGRVKALEMAIESLSVNTCRTCEYYAYERCQKMKIERLDIVPCEFYREKAKA